jgi:hypothetical protein
MAMKQALPLRDIHLPEGVSWWPLAPGWWLLLALLVLCVAIVLALRFYRRRLRLRKLALAELQQIEQAFAEHGNLQQLAGDCSVLLRRVCLSRFPRHEVAGLTDRAWLTFLNSHSKTPPFDAESARILLHAPYQPQVDGDADVLLSACRSWLQQLPAGAVS